MRLAVGGGDASSKGTIYDATVQLAGSLKHIRLVDPKTDDFLCVFSQLYGRKPTTDEADEHDSFRRLSVSLLGRPIWKQVFGSTPAQVIVVWPCIQEKVSGSGYSSVLWVGSE